MTVKSVTFFCFGVSAFLAIAASGAPCNLRGENPREAYFRKSVKLAAKPKSAVVRVFSDTGYELFVNGRLAVTLCEWANVRDYDLTPFFRAGRNQIAVHATNYGGHRGFAFELSADGESVLVSDGTWRTFPEERWNWTRSDFDESGWRDPWVMDMGAAGSPQWRGHAGDGSQPLIPTVGTSPFFTGAIPKGVDSPFYAAERPLKVMPAAKVSGTFPTYTVDLGEEVCGFFRMRVKSAKGVRVRTRQAESVSELNSELDPREPVSRMLCQEYLLDCGVQEFESRDRMGGRFVRVEFLDVKGAVDVDGFSVRHSYYPVDVVGEFESLDPVLNDAWKAAVKTLHLNMQEFYLDAIKRDRMLWIADLRAEALANYVLFGDTDLVEFCLRELAKRQYADGLMPSSYGTGLSSLWDFVCWYVIAWRDHLEFTGNADFAKANAASIRAALDWLISKTDGDGLIAVPENPIRPLWMVVLNKQVGKDTFLNDLFLDALKTGETILSVAGDVENARRFAAHADRISPLVERLHHDRPLDSVEYNLISPTMFYRTVGYQADHGDVEGAFKRVRAAAVNMLACRSGTLAENMSGDGDMPSVEDPEAGYGTGSLCHGWNAQIVDFIATYVAGIRPQEPGWKSVRVVPCPCGLSRFRCVRATPFGPIEVIYENGSTSVKVPEGVTLVK